MSEGEVGTTEVVTTVGAPAAGPGAQGDGQGPGGLGPEESGHAEGQQFDAAYVRQLRQEAAGHRKRSSELEKRLKELEADAESKKRAELSETERLRLELEETKAKAAETDRVSRERMLRSAVTAEAVKAGFNDPQDAWSMVDRAELVLGEDGDVSGAEKAIKALVKAKPYLVRLASGPASGTSINAEDGRGAGKAPDGKAKIDEIRQRFRI